MTEINGWSCSTEINGWSCLTEINGWSCLTEINGWACLTEINGPHPHVTTPLTIGGDEGNPSCDATDDDFVVVLNVAGGHQTTQDTNRMQLERDEEKIGPVMKHHLRRLCSVKLHV